LRVLSVASEIYPLVKTGGLADVAGALPMALEGEGIETHSLVPGYPAVLAALDRYEPVMPLDLFGRSGQLLAAKAGALRLFVIQCPELYERAGNIYNGPDGWDWPDNAFRFAALGRVAASIGAGAVPQFVPEVIHAHDWQAGLAPAYLHYDAPARSPGTVMTIHNLAFQGQFPPRLVAPLGFPPEAYAMDGIEYYGSLGFLKAGLRFADRITTVSPGYAREISSPGEGMGFEGLLRARANAFSGILNGLDATVWNPATDKLLEANFDADRLERRAVNKRAVRRRFGLADEGGALLFGVVTRLTWQKGMDLLLAALGSLPPGSQLALLGAGEPALAAGFRAASLAAPGRIGVHIGYDETLAHLMQGGCDALLVPSRFEPCGLTQLAALRYGAVPIVARVGGLADTVIDANPMALAASVATGLQFAPDDVGALTGALADAAELFRDGPTWAAMQGNAMRADVGWAAPAARYARLYREIAARPDNAATPKLRPEPRSRRPAAGGRRKRVAGPPAGSPPRPT